MVRTTHPGLALQPVAQFSLFEVDRDQDPCTNQVELYGLAPRCVFYTSEKERVGPYLKTAERLKTVERNFTHAGKAYKLVLYPARVRRSDGAELDIYPSEREQIVEEILRWLSSSAFPVMMIADARNAGARTYLQFNPLVAQAIRSLDWR